MIDDLQRILGYREAVDERDQCREVGPELVAVPCWTPAFCAALIRAAEATGAFEPQPDDPVPGHEVSLAVISPRLFADRRTRSRRAGLAELQQVWPLIDFHGLRDAFVIRYALGEQDQPAAPSRRRPGVRFDQAQRRLRRRGARVPAPGPDQRIVGDRRTARLALAGDPPPSFDRVDRRHQVRPDDLVRDPQLLTAATEDDTVGPDGPDRQWSGDARRAGVSLGAIVPELRTRQLALATVAAVLAVVVASCSGTGGGGKSGPGAAAAAEPIVTVVPAFSAPATLAQVADRAAASVTDAATAAPATDVPATDVPATTVTVVDPTAATVDPYAGYTRVAGPGGADRRRRHG